MWWPAGVCCQLLATTIQIEEKIEPRHTIKVAKRCIRGRYPVPAEDQQGQEARLEEEGEDPLRRQRRSEDIADEARVGGPVGAELELHHDAGRHADGEVEGEDAGPELGRRLEQQVAGAQVLRLEIDHDHADADGERREDVVEARS